MPTFSTYDGIRLSYEMRGQGPPVVCLAGGPGADVRCLGDLGRLDEHHALALFEARATGHSQVPTDRASCAFTEQARDVEMLRRRLEYTQMAVLAHSAGTLTAQEYAARHPTVVTALVLVTPIGRADLEINRAEVARIRATRAAEDWYAAWADRERPGPFAYGAWTAAARRHLAAGYGQPPPWLREAFFSGAPRADAVPGRLARLAAVPCPVLVVAGGTDGAVGTAPARLVAAAYPRSRLEVRPAWGHWPWVDDPPAFRKLVAEFLAGAKV